MSWFPIHFRRRIDAFTLVELLVVVGIIAILIAILLPTLNKAQAQAKRIQCMSNMRQVGVQMQIYCEQYDGYLVPPDCGANELTNPIPNTNPQQFPVWPYFVCNKVWNPPIMLCPSDIDPLAQHSYMFNAHLFPHSMDVELGVPPGTNDIKFGTKLPNGRTASDVIVMGEKVSSYNDYYMDKGDFDSRVEQYRHGINLGSNYLFFDGHVDTLVPGEVIGGLDPWDLNGTPTTMPT